MSKNKKTIKLCLTAVSSGAGSYDGTCEVEGSISEMAAMLFETSMKDNAVRTLVLMATAALMQEVGESKTATDVFLQAYQGIDSSHINNITVENEDKDEN